MRRHYLTATALLCFLCTAAGQKVTGAHDALAKWVESKGGKVGFKIGKSCWTGNCPRGTIATKAYKEGEVIAEVPFDLSIQLGHEGDHAAANAILLAGMRLKDSQHNETFKLFWETQPDYDEVFSPDIWTEEHIEALQTPVLEEIVRQHRQYTTAVYLGQAGEHIGKSVPELLGTDGPSLEDFLWYSALIVTRAFSFWQGGDVQAQRSRTYLFPSIDMVNHADDPNTKRWEYAEDNVVRVLALKPIKKGQELTQAYHEELLHRPDMSLLVYGFVAETAKPMLAACDRPEFDAVNPYAHTPLTDSEYEAHGGLATHDELQRLIKIRDSWPTSQEDDEKLLKKGIKDWKMETVVKYRVQRKKAVNHIINTLMSSMEEL